MINAWSRLTCFLVVSRHQSASDPLILSFFGLGRSGDIHGSVLGGIMQHATIVRVSGENGIRIPGLPGLRTMS